MRIGNYAKNVSVSKLPQIYNKRFSIYKRKLYKQGYIEFEKTGNAVTVYFWEH